VGENVFRIYRLEELNDGFSESCEGRGGGSLSRPVGVGNGTRIVPSCPLSTKVFHYETLDSGKPSEDCVPLACQGPCLLSPNPASDRQSFFPP
jgi:hypothetical protein